MHKAIIRALILDYGGVISQPQSSKNVYNILNMLNLDLDDFQEIYLNQRGDYDSGQISGEDYWISILQHFNIDQNDSDINLLIQEDVNSWTKINHAMIQFIQENRSKIHKLAIISNITKDSLAFIRLHFRWLELFDVLSFSCEVGINKPDKKIYEACLHQLRISPNECLFVDDSVENVDSAVIAGMNVIHFRSFPEFLQELKREFYLTQ
jgi:putative hydrolase of the HAD superfamily